MALLSDNPARAPDTDLDSDSVVDVFKPAWYRDDPVTDLDMNVVSIFWGMALMLSVFTFGKAARQTARSWARHRRVTAYVAMIWGAWVMNLVPSVVTWFHFYGVIPSSFWLLLFIVLFWSIQIQFLMQIIINRVSLLMDDPVQVRRLKWSVFGIILFLTASVVVIWIPASLQVSETWHDLNAVWDRAKQAVLVLLDVGLNGYFLHCVRNRLIANGLDKYRSLFRLNILMVFIVVALDATFIGLMSLELSTAYLQFQPVAYLSKLYIEMSMAELIRKIVKSTNELNRVAYLSTINGVPVSASSDAPFASLPATPTPTPPDVLVHNGGGGDGFLRPGHVFRHLKPSYFKADIELGKYSDDGGGRGGGGTPPVRTAANAFFTTTTTTSVAEVQKPQPQPQPYSRPRQQRQNGFLDAEEGFPAFTVGRPRGGSETSSTVPLRPRSRREREREQDSLDDGVRTA